MAKSGFHSLFGFGTFCFLNALHPVLNGHGSAIQCAVIDAPAFHAFHRVAQLFQLCLFLLILLQLQIETGLFLIHVERIVTGVEFCVSVGNFNDPLSNFVQEVPVVGDSQHCALKAVDIALQPLYTT